MSIPYQDWRCEKTFELYYECPCCKKDPETCKHNKHTVIRWKYSGGTLVDSSGLCYDCGKSLKLNQETKKVE